MSTDKTKGNSGNTAGGATPPGNGSEQPDGKLETLLAEWDQGAKGTDSGKPDKGKPAGTGKSNPLEDRIARLEAEAEANKEVSEETRYKADIPGVVATLKGDLNVNDDYVEWWINREAKLDPRLAKSWDERDTNQAKFRQVIEALAPSFQKHAKEAILPKSKDEDDPTTDGKGETKDDKGLGAAVRSSRDAKPSHGDDDVNWAGLSGHEFALKRAEVFKAMKEGTLK